MSRDLFGEILDDVTELVRREAASRRGKLSVSPETAAALNSLGDDDREASLEALAAEVARCTNCALCNGRKQTVFSDGNPFAEILFVGEGPGAEEDKQGIPFVGPAGQVLTRIIESPNVLNLNRQTQTYICNVVKCRPPENREPNPEESAACFPYLARQIELVRPRVIVALGGTAAKALLDTTETVGRLRKRWHDFRGTPVRVTYHPSYLLRIEGAGDRSKERQEKLKVQADLQEVLKFLSGESRAND